MFCDVFENSDPPPGHSPDTFAPAANIEILVHGIIGEAMSIITISFQAGVSL